jgi:hypothetical protein
MKCATLVLMFLVVSPVFAAVPSKEPADLVKARLDYEAKVKAAVDPITAAYLEQLDAMMKAYGAAGDLDSAQAVKAEIKARSAGQPSPAAPTAIGKWLWPSGEGVELKPNGEAVWLADGHVGKWSCLDRKARRYAVAWKNGTDYMILSADGSTAICKNSNRKTAGFVVRRSPEP